jgi:hypothetical protein
MAMYTDIEIFSDFSEKYLDTTWCIVLLYWIMNGVLKYSDFSEKYLDTTWCIVLKYWIINGVRIKTTVMIIELGLALALELALRLGLVSGCKD